MVAEGRRRGGAGEGDRGRESGRALGSASESAEKGAGEGREPAGGGDSRLRRRRRRRPRSRGRTATCRPTPRRPSERQPLKGLGRGPGSAEPQSPFLPSSALPCAFPPLCPLSFLPPFLPELTERLLWASHGSRHRGSTGVNNSQAPGPGAGGPPRETDLTPANTLTDQVTESHKEDRAEVFFSTHRYRSATGVFPSSVHQVFAEHLLCAWLQAPGRQQETNQTISGRINRKKVFTWDSDRQPTGEDTGCSGIMR
ncbi:uncharacterized protein LOC109499297 [Felis catus]|uniref:uncharacterized protein LOC109499297 n=1 Tax=Felis catus TaxID=9685 RepID=UPI001D19CD93|nr:uncharacterized protein LOC109499297 [Felis catus]